MEAKDRSTETPTGAATADAAEKSPEIPKDVIPLRPATTAIKRRRWAESFLASLIPFIILTIAHFMTGGLGFGVVNLVDICLAMISTAVVLTVQLVDRTTDPATGKVPSDVILSLIGVFLFVAAFATLAGTKTVAVETRAEALSTHSASAATELKAASDLIDQGNPESVSDRVRTSLNLANSGEQLDGDLRPAPASDLLSQSALVLVLAGGFLGFAIRVWRTMS
jgi:hypothetical protein